MTESDGQIGILPISGFAAGFVTVVIGFASNMLWSVNISLLTGVAVLAISWAVFTATGLFVRQTVAR